MRHTEAGLRQAAALVLSAIVSPSAHAAVMSLQAVAVNNVPVETRSNHVRIEPGDLLTAELFISNWGEEIDLVAAYQVTVLGTAGSKSGDTGTLVPPASPCYLDVDRPDFIFRTRLPFFQHDVSPFSCLRADSLC